MYDRKLSTLSKPYTYHQKKKIRAKAISPVTFLDTHCTYQAGKEAKANWPPDYRATKWTLHTKTQGAVIARVYIYSGEL